MRSHTPLRIFHHVGHVCRGRRVVVKCGGDRLLRSLEMAEVVASTACRDVIADWSFICLLPPSAQKVTFRNGSSDHLETVLACSGDRPDSNGPTSPKI